MENKKQKGNGIFFPRTKVRFHVIGVWFLKHKYIFFCFLLQTYSSQVVSQKLQLTIDAGINQSCKSLDKSLVEARNIFLTGWQAGLSTHLPLKGHLNVDLGINYVLDGGEREFLNKSNPNEKISVRESMQWIEVPLGLNIGLGQSKLNLGASLSYRHLLKSTAGLSVSSLSDTLHLTVNFTDYRKQNVFFAGIHLGYKILKTTIIEFQYKRSLGNLKNGWTPTLQIQDEPFDLNSLNLRLRCFILPWNKSQ
jgi:hypothetical protein